MYVYVRIDFFSATCLVLCFFNFFLFLLLLESEERKFSEKLNFLLQTFITLII